MGDFSDDRGDWDHDHDHDCDHKHDRGHKHDKGGSFRKILERLVGETVEIQTDDSGFSGKLADVETTFVTLASSNGKSSKGNTSIVLVYIPVRKINAVTNL